MSEFVFMLTRDDRTVPDALDVLATLRGSGLRHVGFKDVGATPEQQRRIADAAHEQGYRVYLEVVSVSREDESASVDAAIEAGVDCIVGGKFYDDALPKLAGTGIDLMPFPGTVVGHPSVLEGGIEQIAAHAALITATPGVRGVDLLAYRNRSVDVPELIRAVVDASSGPVLVAGSVVEEEQIRAINRAGAWGFTIGSAVFEGRLPGAGDVRSQVETALRFAADTTARVD